MSLEEGLELLPFPLSVEGAARRPPPGAESAGTLTSGSQPPELRRISVCRLGRSFYGTWWQRLELRRELSNVLWVVGPGPWLPPAPVTEPETVHKRGKQIEMFPNPLTSLRATKSQRYAVPGS